MNASDTPAPHDPLWPRAAGWLNRIDPSQLPDCDLALFGVPAHATSISPTGAQATPGAVREALAMYSTYSACHDVDIAELSAFDCGDVADPDGPAGESRVAALATQIADKCRLLLAVGGDNSITHSVMRGVFSAGLGECGLITVDAHHDLRDEASNGSPVRRLIEAGLPGAHIVQIGIADFSNSPAYAARARGHGITIVTREALRGADLKAVAKRALDIAGEDGRSVYVDLDVDVCDRSVVPGCPAAAPGGISADELRQLAFLFAGDARVSAIDITEVDATADSSDARTVRLAALLVLEAAAGLRRRPAAIENPDEVHTHREATP